MYLLFIMSFCTCVVNTNRFKYIYCKKCMSILDNFILKSNIKNKCLVCKISLDDHLKYCEYFVQNVC